MESPKTGRAKANRSKQILFIAVSVFVLCIICAAVGVLFQSIVDDSTSEVASQPKQTEVAPTPTIMKESAAEDTPTPEPPTPTPEPTSTFTPIPADTLENGFDSGGLGLSKTEWEQAHTETELDYNPLGTGYDRKYDVLFQEGNVWHIERQWSTNDAVTPEVVEMESKNLIPADSQFIETYSPEGRPETIVNLYLSESLKNRFGADYWIGGEPGNFTIQYNVFDGKVTRLIIAIGNNP